MNFGYARVSTDGQSFDLQMDALFRLGCNELYQDIATRPKVLRCGQKRVTEGRRDGETE
jgi:DNA invertase Pin-like site-specific DNA recombinase